MMRFIPIVFTLAACDLFGQNSDTTVNPLPSPDAVDSGTQDSGTEDSGTTLPPVELMVNGGAEDCSLNGWTPSQDGVVTVVVQQDQGSYGAVLPAEGTCFFSFATAPNDSASVSQVGIATPGSLLTLSGWARRTHDDVGDAVLDALDLNGNVLASVTTGPLEFKEWDMFSMSLSVPAQATSWRVTMHSTLYSGGLMNVYFDGLSLTAE